MRERKVGTLRTGISPDDRTSEWNGAVIHVEEAGSGHAVLCLHGIGSSSRSFADQLAGLGRSRHLLAWDAPGYAASTDPAEAPGMDGYADAAAALLERRGVAPAHVLGVSFGGVIAVRLALRHPRLVRSLILADSTPGSGAGPDSAAGMRRRGDELAAAGAGAFARARAPRLLSPSAPESLVEAVIENMVASIRLPGYSYAAAALAETDHRDAFPQIAVPTLVLCGTEDAVTPPEVSRGIAAAIPGARIALIDGAGHLSNQEQPELFNRLVSRFLDDVEAHAS